MRYFSNLFLLSVLTGFVGCKPAVMFFAGAKPIKVQTYESSAAKLRKLGVSDTLLVFPKDTAAYRIATKRAKELDLHFFDEQGTKVIYMEAATCMAPSFSITKEMCNQQPIRVDSSVSLKEEYGLFTSFNNPGLLNGDSGAYDRVVFVYWYSHNAGYNREHLKDWVKDLQRSDKECRVKLIMVSLDIIDKLFGNDIRVRMPK